MRRSELVKALGASVAAAAAGSAGADPDSLYYRTLRKPRWQPPKLAFPLVWTALYADIGVSAGQALSVLRDQERTAEYRALAVALGVNLSLNTGWCWIFFTSRKPTLAVVECALLAASSADLVRRVGAADRRAGWALAPYPVWCGFATALSAAIAKLNPRRR